MDRVARRAELEALEALQVCAERHRKGHRKRLQERHLVEVGVDHELEAARPPDVTQRALGALRLARSRQASPGGTSTRAFPPADIAWSASVQSCFLSTIAGEIAANSLLALRSAFIFSAAACVPIAF
jgi:hypothetical protein